MNCFFVFFEDVNPQLEEMQAARVERAFPEEHRYRVGRHAWAVASPQTLPHKICEELGIHESSQRGRKNEPLIPAIVVRAESYNGFYKKSLWEQMKLWRAS